jgi:carbonic anhydrase
MSIIGAGGEISKTGARGCFWVGCSDFPRPADEINGALGDSIFHDNLANLITPADLNCLAAMQFAVDVRGVETVVVCGHHGCRGIETAINDGGSILGGWLSPIGRTARQYATWLSGIADESDRLDALCELNVIEQVVSACRTPVIIEAWRRGRELSVRGLFYHQKTDLICDLEMRVESETQLAESYETAISGFRRRWRLPPVD